MSINLVSLVSQYFNFRNWSAGSHRLSEWIALSLAKRRLRWLQRFCAF